MNPRNDAALLCANCDGEPVSALDVGDHFCTRCFIRAWNRGAAWADEHWADEPVNRYQDELSTDGRSILKDHQGFYKRRKGE